MKESMSNSAEDFEARQLLSQLIEPGDPKVGRAVQDFGAPFVLSHFQAMESGRSGESKLRKLKLPVRWDSVRARELVQREQEHAKKLGVDFIVPGTPEWPTQLSDLGHRSPLMLRVRGALRLRTIAIRGIGIVGARACTRYGHDMTEELASRLASNDWTIVSGGAYGIDAAAHRGALAVGGPTVAVSAAGVDQAVPASNSSLFEAIAKCGAVVSEAPLGAHPTRSRFLVRNRLIAALSRGVVVAEAALRSGSLSTAREASELGRILMAVPGPVTSLSSAGGHELIKEGLASLVTGHTDVLDLMKIAGGDSGVEYQTGLDEPILKVLDGGSKGDLHPVFGIDELAERIEMPVSEVLTGLCSLEVRQLVDRGPGGWQLTSKQTRRAPS